MNSFLNITSEIGKLKKVMLHRPGKEIENLVPDYLGRLLFDDIPYLKVAQEEHDGFANALRQNGTEVYYLEDLAAEAINDEKIKNQFLDDILSESDINSQALREELKRYFLKLDCKDMICSIMSGVRKEEINLQKCSSLVELMDNDYPFYMDPMPNLYFTRDPGATIGSGISLSSMRTEARRRETLFLKYIYLYHPAFVNSKTPLWYDRINHHSLEGGDELVLSDEVIAIGCSERSSSAAIEMMANNVFNSSNNFKKILVFNIPKRRAFMHLDTVFTMVDYDKFTIHPGIQGPLNVYEVTKGSKDTLNFKHHTKPLEDILKDALKLPAVELIKCAGGDKIASEREQWNDGSNTLAVAPGVVVTYERNYVTNALLDSKGIKVIPIKSSELSRGRGGPRCMSMPLERENI